MEMLTHNYSFLISRCLISCLKEWLMQHNPEMNVQVYRDLIFASTWRRCIRGHRICHECKRVFRNVARITRQNIRNFVEVVRNLKLPLPPVIDWNYINIKVRKLGESIYTTSIPVSDARRDVLRPAEEAAATLPEKAGLGGANILFLFTPLLLGMALEELAFAFTKSFVKYISIYIV